MELEGSFELSAGVLVGGRYRLGVLLGRGGFGEVWRAEDVELGRFVALKTLLIDRDEGPSASRQSRFEREADVLMGLDHPVIVRALDRGEFEGRAFLVMELVEGMTLMAELKERAAQNRMYSASEIMARIGPIAEGLHVAHEKGVIHRDIKPLNVMITPNGAVKVLDFGLAKLLELDPLEETTLGRRLGSLMYLSPEQALGLRVDRRSDVFALATIAWELSCLDRPWMQPTATSPRIEAPEKILARIVDGSRPPVVRPGASPDLDRVLSAAWERNVETRTPNTPAFVAALGAALAQEQERAPQAIVEARGLTGLLAAARLPVANEPIVRTMAREASAPMDRTAATEPGTVPTQTVLTPTRTMQIRVGPIVIDEDNRGRWLAGTVMAMVIAGLSGWLLARLWDQPQPIEMATVTAIAAPAAAAITATIAGPIAAPVPAPPEVLAPIETRPIASKKPTPIATPTPAKRVTWRARLDAAPDNAIPLAKEARAALLAIPELDRRLKIERAIESSLNVGDNEALGRALDLLDVALSTAR